MHMQFVARQTYLQTRLQSHELYAPHIQAFATLLTCSMVGFIWHKEILVSKKEKSGVVYMAADCATQNWILAGQSQALAVGQALHTWIASAGAPGSSQDTR